MALFVAAVTFLIVLAAFLLVWVSLGNESRQKVVRQRIEAVRKAEQRGGINQDLTLVRDELYSTVPLLHRVLMHVAWTAPLRDFIAQAGMKTKPAKILLWTGVLSLGAYVIAAQFLHMIFLGLLAGLLAASIPIGIVALKRRKRLERFAEMFPEALDLLGRAVRAGHAFTTGLEMIANESPELIAGEFRKAFEERNFGLPMRDALINLSERVPLVDVRFFVTAFLIQKETGGNLAEVLDDLARLIRDRFRIQREVRVKTAQGRLTAAILVVLPILLLIGLEVVNPQYVSVLFTDSWGTLALGTAAALQILGSLLLWKIVHIEV
jgi:tight adherence protein B